MKIWKKMTENQFETVVLSLGSRQYLENSISSIDNLFFPLRIGKIPVYSNERFDKIQQINVDSFNSLQRFSRLCHNGSHIPNLKSNIFLHIVVNSLKTFFICQILPQKCLLFRSSKQALSGDLFKAGPQTAAKSGNASLQSTLDNWAWSPKGTNSNMF